MKIGGQIWLYRTTENVRRETWCTGQQAGQGNRGGFAWAIRGSSSGRLCASRYCQARQARLRPVGVVSCWTRFVSSGPRLQAEVPSCDMFVQHTSCTTMGSPARCTRAAVWLAQRAGDGGASVSFVSSVFRPTLTPAHPPHSCSALFYPPLPTYVLLFLFLSESNF